MADAGRIEVSCQESDRLRPTAVGGPRFGDDGIEWLGADGDVILVDHHYTDPEPCKHTAPASEVSDV